MAHLIDSREEAQNPLLFQYGSRQRLASKQMGDFTETMSFLLYSLRERNEGNWSQDLNPISRSGLTLIGAQPYC